MYDGLCLLKVVLKLALGESHFVKELAVLVRCRENAYSAHWFSSSCVPGFDLHYSDYISM